VGSLNDVPYAKDPVFGFDVPTRCPEVPDEILDPSRSWPNRAEYDKKYRQLAARFIDNFRKFEEQTTPEVVQAGPRV
jgi:phosphoenolpyruvate carboxykinase (ATP)